MGFELRDYQSEALAAVGAEWDGGLNRTAVVLPTGAGKTVCFSGLIADRIEKMRAEGKRVLVIAHRGELLEQAEAKIKAMVPGVWTAIVKGARGHNDHKFADVIVASVQTLSRPKRRDAIDRIGMVIVDECHRYAAETYKTVLAHYGCMDEDGTPTVGFTATMTRMNGGLPDVWQSIAYQKKIHWMIKRGYLVPPVAKSINIPGLNLASARVTGGDLNTKDLADALDDSQAFTAIAEEWCSQANERQTIVFMPNVETCHRMVDALQTVCGAPAEAITGSMSSQARKAAYERFNAGTTRVLVSCMVLTEGFDAPATSCVIIGRPTLNPGLYIQMVGRGLRLADGKTDCLVLDIAGASLKHNLAGVNDLETDCAAKCDCNCLSCGCSDRCKCGIRKCGCRCVEQHEKADAFCRCAATDDCGCGCPGDLDGTGLDGCVCKSNPECGCRGDSAPEIEKKEVHIDTFRNLTEVDILGEQLAASSFTWLSTKAGINFLPVGQDVNLFLLPAPQGAGWFQGIVRGSGAKAPVTRLDEGATDAATARQKLEEYADGTGYTYNNRKASWRRSKASDAQISLLRRLGVETTDGMKKGEASDLLSVLKASWALDERFGKYIKQGA